MNRYTDIKNTKTEKKESQSQSQKLRQTKTKMKKKNPAKMVELNVKYNPSNVSHDHRKDCLD